jgi:xylulose-5-phosphate/fructose-6-phosphate phosphoketolase
MTTITMKDALPLTAEEVRRMNAYWRAANYLSVGQIYLYDNPLLREPLKLEHVKPRLLGHWGTTPGLNFIYVHVNRLIKKHDLNVIYVCGPGHGGPGMVANTYLEQCAEKSGVFEFADAISPACLSSRDRSLLGFYADSVVERL